MKKLSTFFITTAIMIGIAQLSNAQQKTQVVTQATVKTTSKTADSKQTSAAKPNTAQPRPVVILKPVVKSQDKATNQQSPKPATTTNPATRKLSGKLLDLFTRKNTSSSTERAATTNQPRNMNNNTRTADGNRQNSSPTSEVVVTGLSPKNQTTSPNPFGLNETRNNTEPTNRVNQQNTNDPQNTNLSETDLHQVYIDPQTGGSQYRIVGNKVVYDSTSNSVRVFGQEVVNINDLFGLIKNKAFKSTRTPSINGDANQAVVQDTMQPVIQNNSVISLPFEQVTTFDISNTSIIKSEDITAEAELVFKTLRNSDAVVKSMDARLVSNDVVSLESYFGREIHYQAVDGSVKILRLYLQKYKKGEDKFCMGHVTVSLKGTSQSLRSTACFIKDINNEAQLLFVQDCFGLIITPGATANSFPCTGDFNWETVRAGVGNFL